MEPINLKPVKKGQFDNMIMHPNLSVGNGSMKMYQLDSNTKSLNNGTYHIEYENQESPRNEKPESQDDRKTSS